MFQGKKIISIIPARGGSKGLPGKNIRPLLGKPLIAWTIETAKKSRYIDKLIVSTDSAEIASVAKKYGAAIPFLRPAELATDTSPTIDTVLHALNWFNERKEIFDINIVLEPTSPLRKDDDLDRAIVLFGENIEKADGLMSVGEVHLESPFITQKLEGNYLQPLITIEKDVYGYRQQQPKAYFPYGVVCLTKASILRAEKTFYPKRLIPYFIERWQNYEIDDVYDFICVEAILNEKLKEL